MKGKITLIGAGPGEPELLTIKAVRKLQEADAVFYDRLINQDLLNYCHHSCEKIDVGKQPKHHKFTQAEIENMIIKKAKEGKKVVRLKSGDPYVFGRGGEEGKRIVEENLEFEVIPGITSAIGGLAYAGIPITHRDFASSFRVITGHLKSEENQLDWANLANSEGTLVFLMGMSELGTIVSELIKNGKDKETPVAIVRWATRQEQKTVIGTLETIEAIAEKEKMGPPSLIVIGEVVTQRAYLNFYESLPLFGKRVVLPFTESKNMYHHLLDSGASVVELPKLTKNRIDTPLRIKNEKEIVFLDGESISFFIEDLIQMGKDIRSLQAIDFFTIGHHTEKQLKEIGIIPKKSYKTIAEYDINLNQTTIGEILFVGEKSFIDELKQKNTTIKTWIPYEVNSLCLDEAVINESDYLFFPSSKAAHYFLKDLTNTQLELLTHKKIIVMGNITASIFNKYDLETIQSVKPSFESVLDQINKEDLK